MSFDLYFSPKDLDGIFNINEIRAWFSDRLNYIIEGDNQVFYENEETGVYFWFEFHDRLDEDDDPICSVNGKQVLLGINLLRPLFFGHEANIELKCFTEKFSLNVLDLQKYDEIYQPHDGESFIASWTKSSRAAYISMKNQYPELDKKLIASDKLLKLWNWNYYRDIRQKNMELDIFIPKIFLFSVDKDVYTGTVWTDGIPILIPTCDGVCIDRDELVPRFNFFKKMKPREDFFSWNEIKHLIEEFYNDSEDYDNVLMANYLDCPKSLKEAFRKLPVIDQELTILPVDTVIDAEFLE